MAISKIFLVSKLAHSYYSKSFMSNFLRFLKSASRFSSKVLANKRFHFAKSCFCSKGNFLQSQVSKIGIEVFHKSFGKFGSGFFAKLIFSGKFFVWQNQFLAKVLASSWLWCFGKSVLISKAKSGL